MTTHEPHTVRLHRVLRAPAERIYRAFLEPAAMVKWLPPHGFVGEVHEMDARVGGRHRMSFRNFGTGSAHSFGGTYVELVPGERIRYTDRFDDPNLEGEMAVTIELRPVACGTDLRITQEEPATAHDPRRVLLRRLAESLELLAKLVEPDPGWCVSTILCSRRCVSTVLRSPDGA
ncbi:MAG: SRPBCC family protein [Planctomycetota bacterium]